MMKQSVWFIVTLAVVLAFPRLGVADNQEESITRVAPDVIMPEKIDQKYFSKHTVMSAKLANFDIKKFSIFLNSSRVDKLEPGPPESGKEEGVFVRSDGGTLLDLWLPQEKYNGRVSVKLRYDPTVFKPYEITVSKVNRWDVLEYAAVVTIIVFGLPIFLIGRIKNPYTINGHPCTTATVLLLDQETDTYSLSKFQFLIWTFVALFGYVFLTVARSLVQGTMVFGDLPANMPGIIAISAGTGVLAPAVTAVRGAKGAGPVGPSPADFIAVGGMVVAERFQFFVWTLIGAGTFLFLILSTDPCMIKDLPSIPPGFLQLMGLSSLGYLGGKLVRKPGPIIDSITAAKTISVASPPASPPVAAVKLTLKVVGRKLSKTARFTIDGTDVELAKEEVKVTATDPDEQDVSPDLHKNLNLEIDRWDLKDVDPHKFLITNPDGQSAEWLFKFT